MKVFGLTGGIGMGKTTAGDWLLQRRVPLIDTDLLARQIVEPGQPALLELQREFGAEIVDADGRLRRDELARIAFSDAAARRKLEAITHPRIRELWTRQVQTWTAERQPLAVVVIPLLFETGAEAGLNTIVCLACSAATQRQRLQQRGWTDEQINQRVEAQWPIAEKMARSDHVVWTEGTLSVLEEQLARIFRTPPAAPRD